MAKYYIQISSFYGRNRLQPPQFCNTPFYSFDAADNYIKTTLSSSWDSHRIVSESERLLIEANYKREVQLEDYNKREYTKYVDYLKSKKTSPRDFPSYEEWYSIYGTKE
jgi:hypothetical protein